MTPIEAVKRAEQYAKLYGRPYVVMQLPGHKLVVMQDGKKRGGQVLERVWP